MRKLVSHKTQSWQQRKTWIRNHKKHKWKYMKTGRCNKCQIINLQNAKKGIQEKESKVNCKKRTET